MTELRATSSSTSEPAPPALAHPRTAGFRLSITDAIVIAVGAVATIAAASVPLGPMTGVFPMAIGHFFLFCNVFRLRRSLELLWTAVFLANFTAWTLLAGDFSWPGVLAIQLPLTAIVIALEMRSPRYHGVFASRLNPRLPDYLSGRLP